MQSSLDYDSLALEAIANGGFTIALDNVRPSRGFAVAVNGHEYETPRAHFDGDTIYTFVIENGHWLREPGYFIGAENHDGTVTLDLVRVIRDPISARAIALTNGQARIYDLGNHETITL